MDVPPLLPGSRRHLLTMVCRASGASAAMTDSALSACWQTEGGRPHPSAAQLSDMTPVEDGAVLTEILERLEMGAVHVHRTGPSGATYYVYDGRGSDLNRIVWYWQPSGDPPAVAEAVGAAASSSASGRTARLALLSDRERAVVSSILAGSRVSTISRSLFLSESTVRSHLSSAFRKLRVRSQAELIERYARSEPADRT